MWPHFSQRNILDWRTLITIDATAPTARAINRGTWRASTAAPAARPTPSTRPGAKMRMMTKSRQPTQPLPPRRLRWLRWTEYFTIRSEPHCPQVAGTDGIDSPIFSCGVGDPLVIANWIRGNDVHHEIGNRSSPDPPAVSAARDDDGPRLETSLLNRKATSGRRCPGKSLRFSDPRAGATVARDVHRIPKTVLASKMKALPAELTIHRGSDPDRWGTQRLGSEIRGEKVSREQT